MTYRVDFTTAAAREIEKIPEPARGRVLTAIGKLAIEPRLPGTTKLVGLKTAWRIRVGDYRVIYDIYDDCVTVTVVRVAHRREAYDR